MVETVLESESPTTYHENVACYLPHHTCQQPIQTPRTQQRAVAAPNNRYPRYSFFVVQASGTPRTYCCFAMWEPGSLFSRSRVQRIAMIRQVPITFSRSSNYAKCRDCAEMETSRLGKDRLHCCCRERLESMSTSEMLLKEPH